MSWGRINATLLSLILVTGLAIIAMLARSAHGGQLDPPGTPASTMRPLDELLPAWDRAITAVSADPCSSPRFQCVLPDPIWPAGAAVLDRETGLVWERQPNATEVTWSSALERCVTSQHGGRYGWRMPSVDELSSLLFADAPGPFDLSADLTFWTKSTYDAAPGTSWIVDFSTGVMGIGDQENPHRVWCVRGGTDHAG